MSILSFLLGEKKKSAAVAKERLQLIIAHERAGGARVPQLVAHEVHQVPVIVVRRVHVADVPDARHHLRRGPGHDLVGCHRGGARLCRRGIGAQDCGGKRLAVK